MYSDLLGCCLSRTINNLTALLYIAPIFIISWRRERHEEPLSLILLARNRRLRMGCILSLQRSWFKKIIAFLWYVRYIQSLCYTYKPESALDDQ